MPLQPFLVPPMKEGFFGQQARVPHVSSYACNLDTLHSPTRNDKNDLVSHVFLTACVDLAKIRTQKAEVPLVNQRTETVIKFIYLL